MVYTSNVVTLPVFHTLQWNPNVRTILVISVMKSNLLLTHQQSDGSQKRIQRWNSCKMLDATYHWLRCLETVNLFWLAWLGFVIKDHCQPTTSRRNKKVIFTIKVKKVCHLEWDLLILILKLLCLFALLQQSGCRADCKKNWHVRSMRENGKIVYPMILVDVPETKCVFHHVPLFKQCWRVIVFHHLETGMFSWEIKINLIQSYILPWCPSSIFS